MVDLDKLNNMLDTALEAETTESLNQWIDEQLALDRAEDMFCNSEVGLQDVYDKETEISTLSRGIIKAGMSEHVRYNKVEIIDAFDSAIVEDCFLVA